MIAALSGSVLGTRGRALILDVHGVGYRVIVSSRLLATTSGTPLQLAIHTHQTSDASTLFGFASEGELALFERLISVNGVGPKTGMDILETPREEFLQHLEAGDSKALSRIPGIGPKTASRIILELKGKLTDPEADKKGSMLPLEAVEALESLGYKKKDILARLKKIPEGMTGTEELVRWFLGGG